MSLQATSSQTVGPFFKIGLDWLNRNDLTGPGVDGRARDISADWCLMAIRSRFPMRCWKSGRRIRTENMRILTIRRTSRLRLVLEAMGAFLPMIRGAFNLLPSSRG